MTSVCDNEQLKAALLADQGSYRTARPFPHTVIDGLFKADVLHAAVASFPEPGNLPFYRYDNPFEKKLAFDQVDELSPSIREILFGLSSPLFLRFLETLTGIDGLLPDPYFRGGGIHQIEKGGKLDVHVDFNVYEKFRLYRRLNVIVYLNEDWPEEYGGHLELWRGHQNEGKHVLDACEERIAPIFNRMVVFSTSEHSYHGHPEPLACPVDRHRRSIAAYYYTAVTAEQAPAPHSTTFVRRPHEVENAELEALRAERNQGRLASNVNSDLVVSHSSR